MALQAMDSNTKLVLGNIEASYKTLMQSSASASDFYKQIVKDMTDIMASDKMGAEAKQTAIDNQTQMLKSGLDVMGKVGNLDLSGLLDFSSLSGTSANPIPIPADTQSSEAEAGYKAPNGTWYPSELAYRMSSDY
jgi:hypothetical protein